MKVKTWDYEIEIKLKLTCDLSSSDILTRRFFVIFEPSLLSFFPLDYNLKKYKDSHKLSVVNLLSRAPPPPATCLTPPPFTTGSFI